MSVNGPESLVSPKFHHSPSRLPSVAPSHTASDIRHVTSLSPLSPTSSGNRSNRASAHYFHHTLPGSNSMPSSPNSTHSGSSAIFERDVEGTPTLSPITTASSTHSQPNPHHMPRGHTTIDQSVPSVLDSAAEILTQLQLQTSESSKLNIGLGNLVIEAPAGCRTDGWASSSVRSRSPSPTTTTSQGLQESLLLSIPASPAPASPETSALEPELGANTTKDPEPQHLENPEPSSAAVSPPSSPHSHHSVQSLLSPTSHTISRDIKPLKTSQRDTKRLSFISYTDILTSTPTSTIPLSSLFGSNSHEPPHITGVGLVVDSNVNGGASTTSHSPSRSPQSRSPSLSPFSASFSLPNSPSHTSPAPIAPTLSNTDQGAPSGPTTPSKRSSLVANSTRNSLFLDDLVGGEWEREGFGTGLDERLEKLDF
ncbi:hypothetical protein BDP27DRAFT_1324268 [Rhodocollybia butyracea]|uniref:Uncharacterized protein n=1 Tax=Rhodocollybia butyracea TaxID=206335 RepID=A0A9P5PQ44_9AGAR|nr:hypothetical protein BDP27DRAFT_1324268 [Rhodocollybia butyracea]